MNKNNDKEILKKISEIIESIPNELHKFKRPDSCSYQEWDISTPEEKGFLLIKNILVEEKKPSSSKTNKEELNVLNLGKGPTFWTLADEDMFFNCLYSLASFVEVKGQGVNLYLYYKDRMSVTEKKVLIGLMKRYQMELPEALKDIGI